MENEIFNAGNVIPEEITLLKDEIEYDVKAHIVNVVLHEDLFSNVITGYAVFSDSASMITQFGITGTELLRIRYKTPGFRQTIEGTFHITSVDERVIARTTQAYVLHFMSQEGFLDNSIRLSKKFSGKTDDIVKDIFNEISLEKQLIIYEDHNTSLSFVSPFWSPLKCINWVTNRSYQSTPGVLFYETNKNFYLNSIDDLIREGKDNLYESYLYFETARSAELSLEQRYKFIKKINAVDYLNIMDAQDYGYLASKLVTHDVATKEYREFIFDGVEYYNAHEHSEEYSMLSPNLLRNPESHLHVRTNHYNLFNDQRNFSYDNWVMQRNHILYQYSNLKLTIEVFGKTDIEVGQMIGISIPKSIYLSEETPSDDVFDPYLTGKYLITNIRHEFTFDTHNMILECIKESFSEPIK